MDRLFGLPAHPLVVHFPVVAIPVVAIAAIALVVRSDLRTRLGPIVVALAAVTTIATFVAAASGNELSEILDAEEYIDTHKALGTQLQWIVLVLTLAIGGLVAMARRPAMSTAVANGTGLAVTLLAALALIWVVRTGHEGAKATWDGVLPADEIELATSDTTTTSAADTTTTSAADETTTSAADATTTSAADTTTTTAVDATTSAADATTTTGEDGAPDTSEAPTALGMAIYEANCQRCHRADGTGGRGPSLVGIAADQPDPQEQINQIIAGGRGMPAFGERLTTDEIDAVVDYIRTTFV